MSGGRSYIDPFEPAHVRRRVAEFGSPLLIVDCARVRGQYRALARALPGVDLHYALKPTGFLVLGPSESIGPLSEAFRQVEKTHRIYCLRPAASAAAPPRARRRASSTSRAQGLQTSMCRVKERDTGSPLKYPSSSLRISSCICFPEKRTDIRMRGLVACCPFLTINQSLPLQPL